MFTNSCSFKNPMENIYVSVLAGNWSSWACSKSWACSDGVVVLMLVLFSKPLSWCSNLYVMQWLIWDVGSSLILYFSYQSLWCALQGQIPTCAAWVWAQEFINNFMRLLSWPPPFLQSMVFSSVLGLPFFGLQGRKLGLYLPRSAMHFLWLCLHPWLSGRRTERDRKVARSPCL